MLDKENVKNIIEENFFNTIYVQISDYLSNYSIDLESIWNLDYVELDTMDIIDVTSLEFVQIKDEIEISGELSIEASLDGYLYYENERHNVDYIQYNMHPRFVFYLNGEIAENFEILNMNM